MKFEGKQQNSRKRETNERSDFPSCLRNHDENLVLVTLSSDGRRDPVDGRVGRESLDRRGNRAHL